MIGKVLKVREVGDPILNKKCDELDICDHLDGIVFLEKVKGPNGFATKENIDKYNLRKE